MSMHKIINIALDQDEDEAFVKNLLEESGIAHDSLYELSNELNERAYYEMALFIGGPLHGRTRGSNLRFDEKEGYYYKPDYLFVVRNRAFISKNDAKEFSYKYAYEQCDLNRTMIIHTYKRGPEYVRGEFKSPVVSIYEFV